MNYFASVVGVWVMHEVSGLLSPPSPTQFSMSALNLVQPPDLLLLKTIFGDEEKGQLSGIYCLPMPTPTYGCLWVVLVLQDDDHFSWPVGFQHALQDSGRVFVWPQHEQHVA